VIPDNTRARSLPVLETNREAVIIIPPLHPNRDALDLSNVIHDTVVGVGEPALVVIGVDLERRMDLGPAVLPMRREVDTDTKDVAGRCLIVSLKLACHAGIDSFGIIQPPGASDLDNVREHVVHDAGCRRIELDFPFVEGPI